MASSPTKLTLALLRTDGWEAEVVERWIAQAQCRRDLFGFIDVLGLKESQMIAVQATSSSNAAARVKKIRDHKLFPLVIKSMRVEVWGWRKTGHRWVVRKVVME